LALNTHLLRTSFELVAERSPNLTLRFYEILFERYPAARALFSRRSQSEQARMLQEALVAVMDHLEDAPWLTTTLQALGAKHVGYGVRQDMYGWVGECLLATVAEVAGSEWTGELGESWSDAYGVIAGLTIDGARTVGAPQKASNPLVP
jgi:hemoglobin-like flavoprotein